MDENETIQIGLDEILRVRHSRSAEMGQRARELRDAARRIEFLRSAEQVVREVKREAGPRNPECENILFGSPETRRQFMEQSMPAARDCQSALENAAKDYESLEAQFKRNTVSLAVVGRMGCGKSRFLQSVSGLDDFYIPSGNGPSCTGTTCIIENVDNDETRVFLSFKNRVMTLKDINAEIARFWKQFAQQGDAPKLETLDQNELRRIYDQLDSAAQNRGLEHKQRQEWEQSKEIYINQWDKWTPLVRPDEEEKELWVKRVQAQYDLIYVQYEGDIWFELGNHSRIREFAAKFSAAHEGNDNLEAHSYHVATDKLLIQKRFQGIQANHLRLIDTVGIDDPAGETAIRLEKAMDVSESDGIIYIDKYTDGRSPSSYEYETLSTTLKERQEKNPQAGYTMGLLINIASAHPHQDLWAVNYFLPDAPSASDVWKLLVEELGEQEATRINNVVAAPFKQDMDTIRQSSPDLFADNGIQATCAANPVEQRVRIVDFLNQILYNIKEHPGDENRIDEVYSKVESCYEDLIFYLRGHCEMAVTPIFTLGTAVFAGFDYDESSGETIMSKELDGEILPSKPLYRFSPKAKEAAKRQGLAKSYTAEPKYCEQPAVYTIYYALTFASNVAKIMEMKRKQDKKGLKKLFFNPKFSVMVLSFLKTAIPSPLWGIVKPETLGKMVEALQQRYDFPSAEEFLQQRDIVYKRMKRSGDGYYVLEPDIMKFKGDAT